MLTPEQSIRMDNIVKLAANDTGTFRSDHPNTSPFTGGGQFRPGLWCGSISLAPAAGLFI